VGLQLCMLARWSGLLHTTRRPYTCRTHAHYKPAGTWTTFLADHKQTKNNKEADHKQATQVTPGSWSAVPHTLQPPPPRPPRCCLLRWHPPGWTPQMLSHFHPGSSTHHHHRHTRRGCRRTLCRAAAGAIQVQAAGPRRCSCCWWRCCDPVSRDPWATATRLRLVPPLAPRWHNRATYGHPLACLQ
jgi:hypothetical protein